MSTKYFRRRWDESRGDDYDSWGPAVYYFETDSDLTILRQIEVYDAGQRLLYDDAHAEDEYGRLGYGRLFPEGDPGSRFEITAGEFASAWSVGRNT